MPFMFKLGSPSNRIKVVCAAISIYPLLSSLAWSETDILTERYVVNGDVNKDGTTDLDDLCNLGLNWARAADKYAVQNSTLATDISNSWGETMSATLLSQARAAAFDTELVANIAPSTKAISKAQRARYIESLDKAGFNTKGTEPSLGIGFAVDLPAKGQPIALPRKQIFNIPADPDTGETPLIYGKTLSNVHRGGYQESSITNTDEVNRYNLAIYNANFPVDSTEFKFASLSTSFEEASILGFDIGVSARYAAFTGSLDFAYNSEFYADRRNFKLVFLIRQSYGWTYMPSDAIEENLTDEFRIRRDLAIMDDTVDLTEEFGQYVATAEHRVRSLVITISVETYKEEDRTEFGGRLKAAFDGVGYAFSLNAGLRSLKENNVEIRNIEIDVSEIGGPSSVMVQYPGELTPISRSVQAEMLDIAQKAANGTPDDFRYAPLLDAWIQAGNLSNASAVDFVYSPIADFQKEDRNPLGKSSMLRAWFKKYLETDQALARANKILASIDRYPYEDAPCDPDNTIFEPQYEYLNAVPAFTNPTTPGGDFTYGGKDSYLEYARDQYCDTVDLYRDLFIEGQKIVSSTVSAPETFQPQDPFWDVPGFYAPTYSVSGILINREPPTGTCDTNTVGTFCTQCVQADWNVRVNGLKLRDQSRYQLIYLTTPVDQRVGFQYQKCDSAPSRWEVTRIPNQEDFTLTFGVKGQNNNTCGGVADCYIDWLNWDLNTGVLVGLYDTQLQLVVDEKYLTITGARSEPSASFEVLANSGTLVPADL